MTLEMINANATYEAVLQGIQPDILEGMREGLKRRFSMPLYREMFRERRSLVRNEFQAFLDDLIAEPEQ